MQTFLPYPDFQESARVLDNKRLGKQRVECLQLLTGILGVTAHMDDNGNHRQVDGDWVYMPVNAPSRWLNHPASKMWANYGWSLGLYGLAVCVEWTNRGFKDTCRSKMTSALSDALDHGHKIGPNPPEWLGDEAFHLSHKSNLLRKDKEHYGKFWTDVPDDLPYVWPVK
jgi:hypothetical protein